MPTTTELPPPARRAAKGSRRGPYSERESREVEQRNTLIRRLAESGEPLGNLVLLTRLSMKQLRRIVRVDSEEQPCAPVDQAISPQEFKQLHREYARDPANLTWLASLRVDARRNGRAMSLQGAPA